MTPTPTGQSSVNLLPENIDAFPKRMKLLIEHFKAQGGAAEIARRCGFSEGVIRSWRDGATDPSRARCVQLAEGTGASLLWLITGDGPMWPSLQGNASDQSQDLSLETLKLAVQTVEEARQIVSLPLSPEKAGEVVSLVYQLLCSGLAEAEIIPITRQALKVAKGEAGNAGGSTAAAGRQAAGSNR